MSLLQLARYTFVKYDRICGCEVVQNDDKTIYVKWYTEDGEFKSDAHPTKKEALKYIEDINQEIIKHSFEDFSNGFE